VEDAQTGADHMVDVDEYEKRGVQFLKSKLNPSEIDVHGVTLGKLAWTVKGILKRNEEWYDFEVAVGPRKILSWEIKRR